MRVAIITAVIVGSSPHLSHPLRTFGRSLIAIVAICAVALELAYPIGALVAVLVGTAAAAVTHLLLGSPAGRPSPERVIGALSDLGLDDAEVTDLDAPFAGVSMFTAHVPGQPALLVSVLGSDERDAQTISSAWSAATRRGERLSLTTTRLARVEHAAMMSLMAERAGVRVLSVVTAGRSAEGDAVLVTHAPQGVAFDALTREAVTDALLEGMWEQVLRLHATGVAHRRIDGSRILLDGTGEPLLTDFALAKVGASDQELMIDRARLMATTALAVGSDRAVAAARRVIGDDALIDLLPYLQPAVLDRDMRQRIRDGNWDLAALRDQVVTTVGVEAPPLEQLRRVTGRSIIQTVLILAITYLLISTLGGINFSELWAELSSAEWSWLLAALVTIPTAAFCFAFSTIGSTTAVLRYGPVLMLQYALQFIALVLPATAARIAMDIRFFQSFGLAAGTAVTIGMIDSFSGFVVQVILLLIIMLSGLPGFTHPLGTSSSSDTSTSTDSSPSLLMLTLVIGLVSIIVALIVPRLRRMIMDRARTAWTAVRAQTHHARGALDVLRHPKNVLQMLIGNLGGQLVQAIVLGLCLAAFGGSASLSQLILINTAVSLFAGLMPVPGGVGVTEAGLTAGLQAIGIPTTEALSTAIAFRLVTFYLPPIYGAAAMRWLRKRSYV